MIESATQPTAAKTKGISQLHFNAINNATSKSIKYSTSTASGSANNGQEENKKLLAGHKKYIVKPSTSGSASGSGSSSSATSPQPSSSNGNSSNSATKSTNGSNHLTVTSANSSAAPSQRTSPIGSPTYYHRPKHFNSMRSVKSG